MFLELLHLPSRAFLFISATPGFTMKCGTKKKLNICLSEGMHQELKTGFKMPLKTDKYEFLINP